jgi:predicted transcriptional regulator
MSPLTRRTTIYLEPNLHRALQLKAIETERSVSEVVNEAVRESLAEDAEDLATFEERKGEATLSFEEFVQELKRHGRL